MRHLDDHITIARELGYSDDVVKRLMKAKSLDERERILVDARRKAPDYIPDTLNREEKRDDQT